MYEKVVNFFTTKSIIPWDAFSIKQILLITQTQTLTAKILTIYLPNGPFFFFHGPEKLLVR